MTPDRNLDANGYTQHNNGDGIEQRTHNGTHQYRFYTDDAAGPWRPTRGEAHQDAHNWRTHRNVTNVT